MYNVHLQTNSSVQPMHSDTTRNIMRMHIGLLLPFFFNFGLFTATCTCSSQPQPSNDCNANDIIVIADDDAIVISDDDDDCDNDVVEVADDDDDCVTQAPNVGEVVEDECDDEENATGEFTAAQNARIKAAIKGPLDEVINKKFSINITRRDIRTLLDKNWLNDNVINYYMDLLTERSEKNQDLPRVYAMNTFFLKRLKEAGHCGVKRWTRKVNIFDMDIIPVPVHVGENHWCMAIINFLNCSIKYYDSLGKPNPNALKLLQKYLEDESMNKRGIEYDASSLNVKSVRDVPRQTNFSDCGVFSCHFAEYICRNEEITFTQDDMDYFRQKMILEIAQGELLQ